MSVIRIKKAHKRPFIILDTTALMDTRLSYRAKGLHTYLMTKPEDWQVHVEYLATQSPCEGREAVRGALAELECAGYVRRERARGERGQMAGWNSIVYETPELHETDLDSTAKSNAPTTGLPKSVEPKSVTPPTTALPKSVLPTSAQPQLVSIDLTQELIREDPPSLSPPMGEDTEQEDLFAHVEGNKNGTHRGNKNGTAPTPDVPQSVPDAAPAQPVYVLTGDGTYTTTAHKTLLSHDPAQQQTLYHAITDDAAFPDWYADEGLTCDVEAEFKEFCLYAREKGWRRLDWEATFKRYLVKGACMTKSRTAPAEPPVKKTKADHIAAINKYRNGGAA